MQAALNEVKSQRFIVFLDVDFTGFDSGKEPRPDPSLKDLFREFLGKDEDNEACEFHLHFDAPDPEREYEQPEAVLAARKKAQQEKRQQVHGEQEAM